jgi:hypothetical protein
MSLGRSFQLSDTLSLRYQTHKLCGLMDVCNLICYACIQVTNNQAPVFVRCLEGDDVLQMIYDNGNLTLDGDKGCGGLYEIHTILDEIQKWFSDTENLTNAMVSDSHSKLADDITESGMSTDEVQRLMDSVLHYIPSEMDAVGLPLCLVDCSGF